MTQYVQQPAQHSDRAATLARTVALGRRQVLLQRRQQEAVAIARAVGHRSQLLVPASGSGGNAARVRLLGRWPGSRSRG